jgi:hypothetical protein
MHWGREVSWTFFLHLTPWPKIMWYDFVLLILKNLVNLLALLNVTSDLKNFKCNRIILNGISIFRRGPRKPFFGDIPEISDEKKKTIIQMTSRE